MSYNILLVDDSSIVRAVMKKTFKIAEVPVRELHEAANGREGLDILHEEWIDIVFLDINMPIMNGLELLEEMSKDAVLSAIPVVIVTTEGSAQRIEELKSKGANGFIRKPFTPEQIKAVVNQIINGSGK